MSSVMKVMKPLPHRPLMAIGILAVVTGIGVFVAQSFATNGSSFTQKPQNGYRVELTAEGFVPASLIIPLGETVTFTSTIDREFWPASNIHPTHDIYPAFDPGRALRSNEEWSFVFDRAGRFRFHDHLRASDSGLIEVVGEGENAQPKELHDCEAVPRGLKSECWDNLLAYTLEEKGYDEAFRLFSELYRTEPDVPKACHGWGHALGQAAYKLYTKGQAFDLRPETAYCGYGFFHGFLERLVGETGDARGAYAFCRDVRAQAGGNIGPYNNCVHGIGHGGAASIIEHPDMSGKYQESIEKSAGLCRSILTDPHDLRNCYDGVFNELVLDMWNGKYGLSRETFFDAKSPLAFCFVQEHTLRASCYFEYMGVFSRVFNNDFAAAAAYVAKAIPEETHAAIAMSKLTADFMQNSIVKQSFEQEVVVCRSLPVALERACLNGIQIGLIAHGEPEREYEKALAFCASSLLSPSEQRTCVGRVLYQMRAVYSAELFLKVCALLAEADRAEYCPV